VTVPLPDQAGSEPATTEATAGPPPPHPAPYRTLPRVGSVLVGGGALLILLLHVLPPSNRINPLTHTISEYALGSTGWIFDVGVLALAAGSLVLLACLVRVGVARPVSGASLLVFGWSAALTVLVVFQKYDFAHGQHTGASGMIHRMASLVAFLCLPPGALLLARAGRRNPVWRAAAVRTRWAAVVAVGCLCLLFYAVGQSFVTDIAWWRVFPLGAMERLIALAEVAVVLFLARWALLVRRMADAS
jgi:hypothetical protein